MRPKGSNADEWCLFLVEHSEAPEFLAVQIATAIESAESRHEAQYKYVRKLMKSVEGLRQCLATIVINGERNSDTTVSHLANYAQEVLDKEAKDAGSVQPEPGAVDERERIEQS